MAKRTKTASVTSPSPGEPGREPKLLDRVRGAMRVRLLGHANVKTTMIYTHVLNRGGLAVESPADIL